MGSTSRGIVHKRCNALKAALRAPEMLQLKVKNAKLEMFVYKRVGWGLLTVVCFGLPRSRLYTNIYCIRHRCTALSKLSAEEKNLQGNHCMKQRKQPTTKHYDRANRDHIILGVDRPSPAGHYSTLQSYSENETQL